MPLEVEPIARRTEAAVPTTSGRIELVSTATGLGVAMYVVSDLVIPAL